VVGRENHGISLTALIDGRIVRCDELLQDWPRQEPEASMEWGLYIVTYLFDSSVWGLNIFSVEMVYLDYIFSACRWCDRVAGNKQRRKQTKHRPRVTTPKIARETFLLKKLCIKQTSVEEKYLLLLLSVCICTNMYVCMYVYIHIQIHR